MKNTECQKISYVVSKMQKYTFKIYLLITEFIKIVSNEILHIQSTTHNAIILFWLAGLNLNIPANTREYFVLYTYLTRPYLYIMLLLTYVSSRYRVEFMKIKMNQVDVLSALIHCVRDSEKPGFKNIYIYI
jgi:hypothetical protein